MNFIDLKAYIQYWISIKVCKMTKPWIGKELDLM